MTTIVCYLLSLLGVMAMAYGAGLMSGSGLEPKREGGEGDD